VEIRGGCYCVCKNLCESGFLDTESCGCSHCYDSFGFPGNALLKIQKLIFTVANGGACDDSDPCTIGDTCSNLVCTGTSKCDVSADCEIGVCDALGTCSTVAIANCTTTNSTTTDNVTTSAPETGAADEKSKKNVNVGGIVAGVIVAVAVLAAGVLGFLYYMRRRKYKKQLEGEQIEMEAPDVPSEN
jgi:hypothetical protein